VPPRQAVHGEILNPHAGVKKFRLVAGHNEMVVAAFGNGFAGVSKITSGGGRGGMTRVASQLRPRTSQQRRPVPPEPSPILRQDAADLGQGRLGDDRLVGVRGA
jgi:hypothetical protein